MPKVMYDPYEDLFYLTGNGKTFVLARAKMGQSLYVPDSIGYTESKTLYTGSVGAEAEFEVFLQDMNRKALKLIKNIDYEGEGIEDPQLRLKYRYGWDKTWRYSPWRTPNLEGVSWHMVSCTDVIICLKGTAQPGKKGYVSGLSVRYTPVDMRGLKGLMEQGSDYA